MLTINDMTRAMTVSLRILFPFEINLDAIQVGQLNIDYQLDRIELDQTLDDFIAKIIEPGAASLAAALRRKGARYSLPLELPSSGQSIKYNKIDLASCRHSYNGCNIRGIIKHNQKVWRGGAIAFVEAIRFDVLWSK